MAFSLQFALDPPNGGITQNPQAVQFVETQFRRAAVGACRQVAIRRSCDNATGRGQPDQPRFVPAASITALPPRLAPDVPVPPALRQAQPKPPDPAFPGPADRCRASRTTA